MEEEPARDAVTAPHLVLDTDAGPVKKFYEGCTFAVRSEQKDLQVSVLAKDHPEFSSDVLKE